MPASLRSCLDHPESCCPYSSSSLQPWQVQSFPCEQVLRRNWPCSPCSALACVGWGQALAGAAPCWGWVTGGQVPALAVRSSLPTPDSSPPPRCPLSLGCCCAEQWGLVKMRGWCQVLAWKRELDHQSGVWTVEQESWYWSSRMKSIWIQSNCSSIKQGTSNPPVCFPVVDVCAWEE